MPGFVLLVRDRDDGDISKRVGFTVSKKVGKAVVRNRMEWIDKAQDEPWVIEQYEVEKAA